MRPSPQGPGTVGPGLAPGGSPSLVTGQPPPSRRLLAPAPYPAPWCPGPRRGASRPRGREEPRNLPPGRCSWPRLGAACSPTRPLLRGACASPWVLPALFILLAGSQLPSLPPPLAGGPSPSVLLFLTPSGAAFSCFSVCVWFPQFLELYARGIDSLSECLGLSLPGLLPLSLHASL